MRKRSHTSKKSVSQESFSIRSKDDRIATFFIRCLKNLFYGMTQGKEDFGHELNAWKANLILYSLTEILEAFFDFLKVHLLLLFFGSFHHRFSPRRHSFSVKMTNRFNRV